MTESEKLLAEHLKSARFLSGTFRGRWKLIDVSFPFVWVEVAARDGRRFTLRFDCNGYPDLAPSARPWDRMLGQQLADQSWPRGGRVSQVFNPGWKGGTALYLPCDRESIAGHGNWLTEHPALIWDPKRGLVQYLEAVHEILQSHELVEQAA